MRALLGSLALAAMTLVGFGAPASAASQLELSADGVHWAATLPGPLFNSAFRWVPGDSETASFFVRNHTGANAVLNLSMLATQGGALAASGVTVQARADSGAWVGAAVPGNQVALLSNAPMPGKAVRKIDVRVTFPYGTAADNASQDRKLGLNFNVTLTQTGGGVTLAPTGGSSGGGSGPTSSTGGGALAPHAGAGQGVSASHDGGSISTPTATGPSSTSFLPSTGSSTSPLTVLLAVLLTACGATLALVSQRAHVSKERESSHA